MYWRARCRDSGLGGWWTDAYRIFFPFSMKWGGWFHGILNTSQGGLCCDINTPRDTGTFSVTFLRFWILICKVIGFSQIISRGPSPYKNYNRKRGRAFWSWMEFILNTQSYRSVTLARCLTFLRLFIHSWDMQLLTAMSALEGRLS